MSQSGRWINVTQENTVVKYISKEGERKKGDREKKVRTEEKASRVIGRKREGQNRLRWDKEKIRRREGGGIDQVKKKRSQLKEK